jgi:hypothetical protein
MKHLELIVLKNELNMKETEFIESVRNRLINISVGASALRNQGASGIVEKSRSYFRNNIELSRFFDKLPKKTFDKYLDEHTNLLLLDYPKKGKSWGAARKALNLYFRELVYNKFICDYYRVPKAKKKYHDFILNLEVPLDKDVAMGIKKNSLDSTLKWIGIRNLDKETSSLFQEAAEIIAKQQGIARVHLDLNYWRA